jgi:hypothetical protein
MAIEWFTKHAVLGCILKLGKTALQISGTAGPLTLMAAMALSPGGVARAIIVSFTQKKY